MTYGFKYSNHHRVMLDSWFVFFLIIFSSYVCSSMTWNIVTFDFSLNIWLWCGQKHAFLCLCLVISKTLLNLLFYFNILLRQCAEKEIASLVVKPPNFHIKIWNRAVERFRMNMPPNLSRSWGIWCLKLTVFGEQPDAKTHLMKRLRGQMEGTDTYRTSSDQWKWAAKLS